MRTIHSIPLAAIRAARNRIEGAAIHTPLLRLPSSAGGEDGPDIWLKLENLQPIGSFKIRGAANALDLATPEQLRGGVWTASAGNFAQGLAWCARRRGISCRVVVPDDAPRSKVEAAAGLGAEIIEVPFEEWWRILENHAHPDLDGPFIHPATDPAVIAGNGTIAFEILEDLPDVDAVVAPYGGGGLCCGLAAAFRFIRPEAKVYACEVETAAPFAAALEAGEPREIETRRSFVDGMGGKSVLPDIWPLAQRSLAGSLVVPLDGIAAMVRQLVEEARVVAEGAGAAPVAAALEGGAGAGKVVCVVSGGHIDTEKLVEILEGGIPD